MDSVSLSNILENYALEVAGWLDAEKKGLAALQKLQKAIANGNVRDAEKLRIVAQSAAELAAQRAAACPPLVFDAAEYLSAEGAFIPELQAAAERAGVKLYVREGLIFSYPVLLYAEPELAAVRIDKRLEVNMHPDVLAAQLKKLQSREPKSRPERFIEALFDAYELVRAKRGIDAYIDLPLTQLYEVLTLLPGSNKEYTLLDFTRDLYFLDASDIKQTKKGVRMYLTASTVGKERSGKILKFVKRDGSQQDYAAIKFVPEQP